MAADFDGKFIRDGNRLVFNFGKYRGYSLEEVVQDAPDYLQWMLAGNFMEDTKALVRGALKAGEARFECAVG